MPKMEYVALFAIFIVCAIALVVLLMPSQGKKRSSDKRRLKGHQKRIYSQVQKLLNQKNIVHAAQLLESLEMHREAISLLEKNGYIKEAAGVLLRIHRPNRAGVVYTRNGMWANAADCFEIAKMPLEVAKCAREIGDYKRAADNFLKAKQMNDAAECYMEIGRTHEATKIFIEIGNEARAIQALGMAAESCSDLNKLEVSDREIDLIKKYVIKGEASTKLADVLVSQNKLILVLEELIKRNKIDIATNLYLRATSDISAQLIAIDAFSAEESLSLSHIFTKVSNHEYAGIILERLNHFEDAGSAFGKAEEYERAAHCFERAGKKSEALEMKIKLAGAGDKKSRLKRKDRSSEMANPFVLEKNSENAGEELQEPLENEPIVISKVELSSFTPDEEESTAIVFAADHIIPATPSVPAPPENAVHVEEFTEEPMSDNDKLEMNRSFTPIREEKVSEEDEIVEARDAESLRFDINEINVTDKSEDESSEASQPLKKESEFESPVINFEDAVHNVTNIADYAKKEFSDIDFLSDLTLEQKDQVWSITRQLRFEKGDVILDFNAEPEGIYFLLQGRIAYNRIIDGKARQVDIVDAPTAFGELWLMIDTPTRVKIVAEIPCVIRVADRYSYNELLDKNGTIARKLYKRFTQRLIERFLSNEKRPEKQSFS